MKQRITDFRISKRIWNCGTIMMLFSIISFIAVPFAWAFNQGSLAIVLIGAGLLFYALDRFMQGFSVLVRKSLNDLVEDGDNEYLLRVVETDDDVDNSREK